MTTNIVLYSGSDCPLCDEAKQLLLATPLMEELFIETIDVKTQRQYFHQYGARIPVLYRPDNQTELGWPFTSSDIMTFLS